MPWAPLKLSNGNEIPGIGYGTGRHEKGQLAIDGVKQAISLGFTQIDTGKSYGNEKEVGQAIKESGVPRKNLFISTKYAYLFPGDTGADTSIKNSLEFLDTPYVDLYLIHRPSLVGPSGIPALWRQFEDYQRKGWTKGIGVCNFDLQQMKDLLAVAKIKPAYHQVLFHPYVYPAQAPLVDFCKANGIVVAAYSILTPLTYMSGGPVDRSLNRIAQRRRVGPEQILLAWAKAKGTVVLTTSWNRERLESYLAAGDIELTDSEIVAIDSAGRRGSVPPEIRT